MDLKTLRRCHGIDLRNIYCGTYTDILDSRVLTMMTGAWPERRFYLVRKLPLNASWGRPEKFDTSKDRYLCKTSCNLPYQIWIVGKVLKMWFIENGNPAKVCNLGIIPLWNDDFVATQKRVSALSKITDKGSRPLFFFLGLYLLHD